MLTRRISSLVAVLLIAWLHNTCADGVGFHTSAIIVSILWMAVWGFASTYHQEEWEDPDEEDHHDLTDRENELIRVGLEILHHKAETGTLSVIHDDQLGDIEDGEIENLAQNMGLTEDNEQ